MRALFNELPGVYIPLKDFMRVRHVWWTENGTLQDSFQVCQFNLILHFGYDVDTEEGLQVFEDICELTRDYPCRVWVICPQKERGIGIELKLFGICHLSASGSSQKGICEAIIVQAGEDDLRHLYDWISSRSDNDLPLYFLSQKALEQIDVKTLNPLLHHTRKILWDSSVENLPSDLNAKNLLDLKEVSLRPIKNALSAFLVNYDPNVLVSGLQVLSVRAHTHDATAKLISIWLQDRLKDCSGFAKNKLYPSNEALKDYDLEVDSSADEVPQSMQIQLQYDDAHKYFRCTYSSLDNKMIMDANLEGRHVERTQSVMLLNASEALRESLLGVL